MPGPIAPILANLFACFFVMGVFELKYKPELYGALFDTIFPMSWIIKLECEVHVLWRRNIEEKIEVLLGMSQLVALYFRELFVNCYCCQMKILVAEKLVERHEKDSIITKVMACLLEQ